MKDSVYHPLLRRTTVSGWFATRRMVPGTKIAVDGSNFNQIKNFEIHCVEKIPGYQNYEANLLGTIRGLFSEVECPEKSCCHMIVVTRLATLTSWWDLTWKNRKDGPCKTAPSTCYKKTRSLYLFYFKSYWRKSVISRTVVLRRRRERELQAAFCARYLQTVCYSWRMESSQQSGLCGGGRQF